MSGFRGLFYDGLRLGSEVTSDSKWQAHEEEPANNTGLTIVHFGLNLTANPGSIASYDGWVTKHNGRKKNRDYQIPLAEELSGHIERTIGKHLLQAGLAVPIASCNYDRFRY